MNVSNKIIPGIHHITAITADAQKNIDFYRGVLGLRLVKLTVNFDDPGSYHLYYGDELGRPGTIMTFFAWEGAQRGRVGPAQVTATAFAVPTAAIDFWAGRLRDKQIEVAAMGERLGEPVLAFADPDGLQLEIVGVSEPAGEPWKGGGIDADNAVHGFHSATISEEGYERTAQLLSRLMGFKAAGEEGNRFRYRGGGLASTIDLLCTPDARHGSMGAGVIHHIAYRTADDTQQAAWHADIAAAGLNVSPVMDRTYFHSIYYREPGGVLFEIATDGPGFTVDQSAEQLGDKLMLPPWLEKHRAEIQAAVTPLKLR
jgi:catechol 2,3-dioxygenase-like lactoylglutathione lyase family enzyme